MSLVHHKSGCIGFGRCGKARGLSFRHIMSWQSAENVFPIMEVALVAKQSLQFCLRLGGASVYVKRTFQALYIEHFRGIR